MSHFPQSWMLGTGFVAVALITMWIAGGVRRGPIPTAKPGGPPMTIETPSSCDAQEPRHYRQRREQMVREQLAERGITNDRVLRALERVPRHEFVPKTLRDAAYDDGPLPIGEDQTISQPYVVAFMTETIEPRPDLRVLEIGTGSGYQAAILGELVGEVYTIELLPTLAERARATLERLGYRNVHVRSGDGYLGWPEAAPFDAIVVTCGADHVPPALVEQLKPDGRMIIPVGPSFMGQSLQLIEKAPDGTPQVRDLLPVRFVPLRRATKEAHAPPIP
jgi:protein-L-isoaspartate(D-aspartate) O-methyltransferase